MWASLAAPLLKLLTWLGTMFLVRRGAKAEVRAESAEKVVEQITEANRPATPDELASVRDRFRRD